jgi:hypothetical protein
MPRNKIIPCLSNAIKTGENMANTSNQNNNHISTDDLAFSAYLKMQGYPLIKSNNMQSKKIFVFNIEKSKADALKLEFINSEFLNFYNELRNIKKIL